MKKPEPWPVTLRGPRKPGKPSGPPKRRKKRSIGEPGGKGESSELLSDFSRILTRTEITDGLTRSTMSANPTGRCTLPTSFETCACAGLVRMSPLGRNVGDSAYAPAPRPPTTVAISANLRIERNERRGSADAGGRDEGSGPRNIN